MSIDIEHLKQEIEYFQRFSTPCDCNSNSPCSKSELTVAVNNCVKLFNEFVDELEKL